MQKPRLKTVRVEMISGMMSYTCAGSNHPSLQPDTIEVAMASCLIAVTVVIQSAPGTAHH
jgi:hypothetical protein